MSRYGIAVVPVPFVFGSSTFHDGVDITPKQFYQRLESSDVLPKTSPPEPGAYMRAWESACGGRADMLVVTVAGRIGTFERSVRMAELLTAERYPGTRVRVLDSGSAGMGQGFVVLAAARAASRGLDLDRACAEATAVARRVKLLVALDTLRYLARTSRIPQVAALVSSILDLKPIIQLADGDVQPVARVRTRERALDRLIGGVYSRTTPGSPLYVSAHHTSSRADAERVLSRVAEHRDVAESYIVEFTPVMGAYCGPGMVGVAFYQSDAGGEI